MSRSFQSDRDNVYLNITINDQYNSKTSAYDAVQAQYNSTNSTPIVLKASDYYCSVLRFDIPLNTIPLMIMPIKEDQPDPLLTPFTIGISIGATNYPSPVLYESSGSAFKVPATNNNPTSEFYWVYTYQKLIGMVNRALAIAWLNSGLETLHSKLKAPYFFLNKTSGLISLIAPEPLIILRNVLPPPPPDPRPDPPRIYMNEALLNYFDAFNVFYYGVNLPDGRDTSFVLEDVSAPYYLNGESQMTTVPAKYYEFKQEYSVLSLWSDLRKILITSNTLPIAYEYTASGVSADTQTPILTDFVPQIDAQGQSRSIAYYQPLSQYRLVDLISDAPIQKVDLRIFWESVSGGIFPLILSQFQQVNIKLGFFHKSIYKNQFDHQEQIPQMHLPSYTLSHSQSIPGGNQRRDYY